MKMTCQKFQSLMARSTEGDLDECLRAEMAAHTAMCGTCAEAWELQSRLESALQAAPMAAPPALYFEGVLAEIHRRMPVQPKLSAVRRYRRPTVQTYASAVMGVLVLLWAGATVSISSFGFFERGSDSQASNVRPIPERAWAVAESAKAAVTLVHVQGLGLIASNSELLTWPPGALREMGLVPSRPRVRLGTLSMIL